MPNRRMTRALACRYSSTWSPNCTALRGSLRNAFTARMPVMVSTKCTMRRAEATRVYRKSFCERTWNQRVSSRSGTSDTARTRPEVGSSSTSAAAVKLM